MELYKDGGQYVGRTKDLEQRLEDHARGKVPSTCHRRPLVFVYAEMSNSAIDAIKREKYLKTAWGKRYIKGRIKDDKTVNL